MTYFNPTIRTLVLPGGGGGGGGGAQGFQGAQGAQGAQGTSGVQGSQGAQGLAAPLASTPTLITASLSTGTTQPISVADALMAGLSANGRAGPSTAGALGVIATSFASSGAETGTGSNQGGLGSAASSTQPYNSTDFPGGHFECQLVKANGEPPALLDMLSTANISFPMSIAAPVYCYGSFRSDLGADLKWRFFFYFRNQVTGVETPFTPNSSLSNVSLYMPQVFSGGSLPTAAGLGIPLAAQGAAQVEFGVTADLVALGSAAAGASGKVMDAASVLPAKTSVDFDYQNHDAKNVKVGWLNGIIDDGTSGTSKTIDWSTGVAHKISLTGNVTFTFTAPAGACWLQIRMTQDGTGSRTVTWPSMKWSGGLPPVLTTTATTGMDIVTIWYDGAAYYGTAQLGFA